MPHVVTQPCCSDGSCVFACPVNCIQPTPDDPSFATSEMLYIDPSTCVDCGACVSACPVGAIKPHSKLTETERPFQAINAEYFHRSRPRPLLAPVVPPLTVRRTRQPLRVAVVGSGPAAMYAADEVLTIPGARVDMYERLPVPTGLARFGVAPDHRHTRQVSRQFDVIRAQPNLSLFVSVEVGEDVTHDELIAGHHAVIYAVGAASDRRIAIPGIELPGVASATEFVAWYNGHPDFADRVFDLSGERAVVIGNGNVALDVARVLTVDPETLAGSEIAPAALAALRRSRIEEVVVVGRRGPAESSFTLPELVGLCATPGVDLLIAPEELDGVPAGNPKVDLLRGLRACGTSPRRIVLRYLRSAVGLVGDRRVEAVELARNELIADAEGAPHIRVTGDREAVPAGLVLTSVGYLGRPLPGLPFDEDTGTIPNERGRVVEPATGSVLPGTFVAGWIKRGPSGFIGTNRSCAQETVRAMVEDFNACKLTSPSAGRPRRSLPWAARASRSSAPPTPVLSQGQVSHGL